MCALGGDLTVFGEIDFSATSYTIQMMNYRQAFSDTDTIYISLIIIFTFQNTYVLVPTSYIYKKREEFCSTSFFEVNTQACKLNITGCLLHIDSLIMFCRIYVHCVCYLLLIMLGNLLVLLFFHTFCNVSIIY